MNASAAWLMRFDDAAEPYALPDFGAIRPATMSGKTALENAYDRGFAAGEAAAAAECQSMALALEARAGEALAAARKDWTEREAAILADAHAEGMKAIEATLFSHVAAILDPLVETGRRDAILKAFAEAVHQATSRDGRQDGPPLSIEITGPADLIGALEAKLEIRLGPWADTLSLRSGDHPELIATIDDTRIETMFGECVGRVLALSHE